MLVEYLHFYETEGKRDIKRLNESVMSTSAHLNYTFLHVITDVYIYIITL